MRSFIVCTVMMLASGAFAEDKAHELLKSDNYSVTWGTVATYDPGAELEIGDGYGHGFNLNWMRFKPDAGGVDVLSIKLDEGKEQYNSKWPPDRFKVVITNSRLKPKEYSELLRQLAIVNSAKLISKTRNFATLTSSNFWVYARLASEKGTLLDLQWAGYQGSSEEVDYAKPKATVALANAAIKGLDFKDHALTVEERSWASAKFTRDWKKIKDLQFYWWVRERYIMLAGVVGDATAFPTIREILESDPKERYVYYAINALTRLTGKDVRDKPVENMDIVKTRQKILELIQERK